MAHLERQNNGSWTIVIEVGRDPETGKRKRITKNVRVDKPTAKKIMARMVTEIEEGTYVEDTDMAVDEYFQFWLDQKRQYVAQETYDFYKYKVNRHIIPGFGKKKVQNIKPSHIWEFQSEKMEEGLSNSTVRAIMNIVKQALGQAEALEIIKRNPASSIKAPSPEKPKHNFLNRNQVRVLLEETEGHYMHDVILFAVHTGLRKGEILGLQWDCVDMDAQTIEVKRALGKQGIKDKLKNESSFRTIGVSNTIVKLLKKIKKEQAEYRLLLDDYYNNDLVFTKENGQPLSYDYISELFRKYADRCNIPARFHDLRHTHATLLHQSGENLKDIQARLGHSSLATTSDIYAKANTTDMGIANKIEEIL